MLEPLQENQLSSKFKETKMTGKEEGDVQQNLAKLKHPLTCFIQVLLAVFQQNANTGIPLTT